MLTILWVTSSGRAEQGRIILASQNPGPSTGVVWTAGDVWEPHRGHIYIWGLSKAVGWLLRFFLMSSLLGLQCPPRRCLHSHICLRRLEQLGGGQHCSLHALSICVLPAGKSQGGWPLTYKTAQNPKSECSKRVKQWVCKSACDDLVSEASKCHFYCIQLFKKVT